MRRPTAHPLSALAAAGVFALGAACGPTDENGDGIADGIRTPDNVSQVAPSTPQGTVSGQVLTMGYTPLAGAQVTLNLGAAGEEGSRTTQTDAAGEFRFTKIPGGAQVQVTITKEGYGTARQRVVVPSSAGNFPINDGNALAGPFALTRLDQTVRVLVVDHAGKPARGARATILGSPAAASLSEFGTYGNGQGAVVVEATADDAGLVTFNGLPNAGELTRVSGRYDLHVHAIDSDGDGVIDSAGRYLTYNAQLIANDPSPRVVKLEDAREPGALQLLTSNVPSLNVGGSPPNQNFLGAGEPIHLVFNQALAGKSVLAHLTDEHGKQSLTVSAAVTAPGNVVTITPGSTIEAGREYNLSVRVVSQDTGGFFQATGYFYGGDPLTAITPMLHSMTWKEEGTNDGQLGSGESVTFNLTVPVGKVLAGSGPWAFFNYDLNGSMIIGDAPGEFGHDNGFPVSLDEPLGTEEDSVFGLKPSGYTTRLRMTYFGTALVPSGTAVRLGFNAPAAPWGLYQTIWGEPVNREFQGGISIGQ